MPRFTLIHNSLSFYQRKDFDFNLSVSRTQCGLCSPTDKSFIPESCRLLLLKSRYFKAEDLKLKMSDKALQLLSERLESFSLEGR